MPEKLKLGGVSPPRVLVYLYYQYSVLVIHVNHQLAHWRLHPNRSTCSQARDNQPLGQTMQALLVGCIRLIGVGYAVIGGGLFLIQRKLQYIPEAAEPPLPSSYSVAHVDIQRKEITTKDGIQLSCWYWPASEGKKYSDVSFLQFHGNAGNRQHRLRWATKLRSTFGCSITLVDYRGYGGSTGKPTEQGLILDAVASIRWYIRQQSSNKTKLVLHLESIGSAAAVNALAQLSAEEHSSISGIVIEGGLSSCIEIVSNKLWFLPLAILMLDKWAGTCSAARQLSANIKLLSLHGDADAIVPLWCGKKLFAAAGCQEKDFIELRGSGHNDLNEHPKYFAVLDSYLRKL